MADGFSIDFSEVVELSAAIAAAPREAATNIRKAVEVTARHVKDDWRKPLEGSATIAGGAASISYDIKGGAGIRAAAITAEIGPELGGQGSIVGILEYGTPTTGARGFGAAALQANRADFEKGLGLAIGQVLP